MKGLNELERAVLEKLLAGSHPALEVLRTQAEQARLKSRELSGAGFFCSFDLPSEVPRIREAPNFEIGDVNAEVSNLEHGAGFVLFVRDGCLDTLEGFSYDEPWPREIGTFVLTYQKEPRPLPF